MLPHTNPLTGDLESVAYDLRKSVDATGVAIVKEDSEKPESMVCVVSVGRCAPPLGARLNPNFGISGRCVRECRSQRSYDTRTDPRVDRTVSERLGICSLAVVPLLAGSRCIGLIEAVSDRTGHFDQDKLLAIEQAACSAALLLRPHQPVSEQPIAVPPPASQQKPAFQDQDESVSEIGQSPEQVPEQQPRGEQYVPASESTTIPTFVEAARSASANEWLRWTAIGVLAPVAIISGILVLHPRFPGHLLPSSRKTENRSTPSTSQAGATVSARTSASVPQTAPVSGNQQPSASQLLAQRAARGDVAAQVHLAESYLKGNDVPADPAKAASWYIIAGENGNVEAKRRSIAVTHGMTPFEIAAIRFNVGKMYMNGIGVDQNYVSAYTWFELAKADGDIRAEGEENTLENKMTANQVEEARQRASQWLQSHSRKSTSVATR